MLLFFTFEFCLKFADCLFNTLITSFPVTHPTLCNLLPIYCTNVVLLFAMDITCCVIILHSSFTKYFHFWFASFNFLTHINGVLPFIICSLTLRHLLLIHSFFAHLSFILFLPIYHTCYIFYHCAFLIQRK